MWCEQAWTVRRVWLGSTPDPPDPPVGPFPLRFDSLAASRRPSFSFKCNSYAIVQYARVSCQIAALELNHNPNINVALMNYHISVLMCVVIVVRNWVRVDAILIG